MEKRLETARDLKTKIPLILETNLLILVETLDSLG